MQQTHTACFLYGVYVVRKKESKWFEAYTIGHTGSDVLMESNVFIQKDDLMESVDQGVEHYGCFEITGTDPYRLRLVRILSEYEKDEWHEWHHLYRELKWKIKSVRSYQSATIEECKEEFCYLQQMTDRLQRAYNITNGEQHALELLLDDINLMLTEFAALPADTTEDKAKDSAYENNKQIAILPALHEHPNVPSHSAYAESAAAIDASVEIAVHPAEEIHDTSSHEHIEEQAKSTSHSPSMPAVQTKQRGENVMNSTFMPTIPSNKQEEHVLSHTYRADKKELAEYFHRFAQLSSAAVPLDQVEEPALQKMILQVQLELSWLKAKILRSLGIHAVHSENKIGEMEFIQLEDGTYANPFQTLVMHSLFESFGKTAKDSASFDAQVNTMIRVLSELFRQESVSSKTDASQK